MTKEQHKYKIQGGWGTAIQFMHHEEFKGSITEASRFTIYGFQSRLPQVGDILEAELKKSWMWFEFVSVDLCGDPTDMFFAKVKPIKQEFK